jgi:hypothetical protein
MKTQTKTSLTPEEVSRKEWRVISEIGWDAPKLKALLPTLKCATNIQEVKKMLKRCGAVPKIEKQAKKIPASKVLVTSTQVTQHGLITEVDNNTTVDFKVGKFSYFCDENHLIVTTANGRGVVNIASYVYKTEEEAREAGWKMAHRQETVEKERLKEQSAVKTTVTAVKKQRTARKIAVTA